jgi:hypothetical protein
MQQWERRPAWEEGLHGKMQQDAAILADGIEHDGSAEGRSTFAQDTNGFRFQARKMKGEALFYRHGFETSPDATMFKSESLRQPPTVNW